ncbi:MAG: threonine synthase [Proteobacteria bacterium]|nr:threonine synthase [Pseudomonadota bacterium]
MTWDGVIRQFWDFLPLQEESCVVSLHEGNTPLIFANRLSEAVQAEITLFLKCEGFNPTGSFKDRGMTVAVSKALEDGAHSVICASTGNTSASAAAYAARGGLEAVVLIPRGKIALGKLSQAMMHGAKVIQIEGNFDEALKIVLRISKDYPLTLVNSLNPHRIEGQKTAAFEICDCLGDAPDYHALPVGNAGNITAYWKGYREYHERGLAKNLPKMLGFQAEGAAPIVRGEAVDRPETFATAIRIGNPASWTAAEAARDESGGLIDMVSDREIMEAYCLVARTEGVFCEPASAASVAGVRKLSHQGFFTGGEIVVCTLTGHGLKDPDSAIEAAEKPLSLPPKMDKVLTVLGL